MVGPMFWVDWTDDAYPTIRPPSENALQAPLMSLRQCQKEIINRARDERKHWLAIINRTNDLTATKIYQGKS